MISKNELTEQPNLPLPYELPKKRRGKHKIYIGMSAGVGKTYRMLEEAHELKEQGIDVVIGLLETHGREETAEVAEGLQIVPRKNINYGGVILTEMDTEAILARQPQLVLIDELAHTNVPGSPTDKRYKDVEIILEAGIDVFSTVNIQHFESLNDVVAKITGVVVREKIPDRLLDEADEVVVVDVTPETLQERLKEGKIYAPDKIDQALQNFFQRHHLVALRELALREVADNLEEEAESFEPFNHHCCVKERILVCVSTYQHSVKLLRRGARIASQMKARLYGLYVSNPERFLTKDESLYIETCEKLCEQFGGKFLRVERVDVTKAIADVAHQYHITQVVLGQTQKSRWQLFLKGSPVQQLIGYLKDVDLHIIATKNHD
ncbi:universal stress protein [Gloeothece verrucosa]|uniref:Osmosensitive K channel signal transduction histidine kinase, sensor subunit KdpD n=1 Tax=Gloeothece verrucosa (strain PCC 7822) TaxID=497965 RepID=E0UCQ0_GLOV7|nr:universal stress protein [Gloeothece verrucosa]ADN15244.1 osmosensitive K channel signal transduction histidine kinase, sensor subunit KdpD [Gloeothece verrucosa PCC 7822]